MFLIDLGPIFMQFRLSSIGTDNRIHFEVVQANPNPLSLQAYRPTQYLGSRPRHDKIKFSSQSRIQACVISGGYRGKVWPWLPSNSQFGYRLWLPFQRTEDNREVMENIKLDPLPNVLIDVAPLAKCLDPPVCTIIMCQCSEVTHLIGDSMITKARSF